ncbi:site-specific DNA-methyltransferase [Acutalibacter sp. 1XD8-36]|uniref:site-specific DNA-methyltransferase n=1 Tax=Acutalibacter sp. 1XD8-36 TaxID=2320852 RepID=UPI001411DABC|nr:site-specific DNA-methyltransferase [Acutalibacter sp. 1XD8-36]NBJ88640.1 site-specific DNA-methyltransferase [Acutalibacter sp. 1XD8-36]
MDKLKMQTPDLAQTNIEKLAALFPACITEARGEDGRLKKAVNFDLLRQMLSDEVLEGGEAYEFTWVGKKAAFAEANKSICKTLRPCPAESTDWDSTENLYIEGDNLEVLKLLQESYLGKVKMIYIDPPYNTGSDFIYQDDFAMSRREYSEESGHVDSNGDRMFRNTDSNGRFHSDWCSMMYSRLLLARNLLSDDGSIFISIDFNEMASLRKIMDEVFGPKNFQREIIWRIGWLSGYKTTAPNFIRNHDTILFYSKNSAELDFIKKYIENQDFKPLVKKDKALTAKLSSLGLDAKGQKELLHFINHENRPERYPMEDTWNANEYDDLNSIAIVSFSGEKISKLLEIGQDFKGQKSLGLMLRLLESVTRPGDIILDFFSGTATTAHAVMELNAKDGGNRKFIMVQLPEPCGENSEAYKSGYQTICEIGKERIRRAADKIAADNPGCKFDGGFRVFKLDDTNMTDVYYSAGEYTQAMLDQMVDNIKPDRTDLDLLFSCLLDWGLPISMPYTSEQLEGCTVHTYNGGDLIACFKENIPDTVIKEIAKRQPLRAVFRDSSFANSPAKINVGEIFKMLAPHTRVKVI